MCAAFHAASIHINGRACPVKAFVNTNFLVYHCTAIGTCYLNTKSLPSSPHL